MTHSSVMGNRIEVRTFFFLDERNSVVAGTEITVHRDQNRVHHDETNEAEVNTLPPFARSKVDMLQAYATAAGKVDLTIRLLD